MRREGVLAAAGLFVALSGCVADLGGGFSESTMTPAPMPRCEGDQSPTSQKAVCNLRNSWGYAFQTTAHTQRETFVWETTEPQALVQIALQFTVGQFELILYDETGSRVYRKEFAGSGQQGSTEFTPAGTPGNWTIEVGLTMVSGQVAVGVNSFPRP